MRTLRYTGDVLRDGWFGLTSNEVVDQGEQSFTLSERLRFDGTNLFRLPSEAEASNAHAGTYARWNETFWLSCSGVRALHAWVSNPLATTLFEGAAYEIDTPSNDCTRTRRVVTGANGSM